MRECFNILFDEKLDSMSIEHLGRKTAYLFFNILILSSDLPSHTWTFYGKVIAETFELAIDMRQQLFCE